MDQIFAVLLVLVMTVLKIVGSQAVAKTQTIIVYVVLISLSRCSPSPRSRTSTPLSCRSLGTALRRHRLERCSHVLCQLPRAIGEKVWGPPAPRSQSLAT